MTSKEDHKRRLTAFYTHYGKTDKLAGVDATIDKFFPDKIDGMWASLFQKYGPEPNGSGGGGGGGGGATASREEHKKRLTEFYTRANKPEKIAGIDATLDKFYPDKIDAMWTALRAKYPEGDAAAGAGAMSPSPSISIPPASETSTAASSPGTGSGGNYRDRLIRYYKHYGKEEKLAGVDATLDKFKGREEAMIKALCDKYGPEPPADGSSGAGASASPMAGSPSSPSFASGAGAGASAGSREEHKQRLVRFYTHYGKTDKLAGVDATIDKFFPAKIEQMWASLSQKYGPEPAGEAASPASPTTNAGGSGSDFRGRLQRFYQKYNPGKLGDVDTTLERFKGREDALFQSLVAKYGAEPSDSSSSAAAGAPDNKSASSGGLDFKQRLTLFYTKYQPEKLSKVDDHLAKYAGREEDYMKALVGKYGPEPTPSPVSSSLQPAPTAAASPGGEPLSYKQRAVLLYQKYQPEKLVKVDDHLAKYAGREEDFIRALVNKYGPEPVPTPSTSSLSVPPQQQQAPAEPLSFKQRLTIFYQKYCPEKLPKVDDHCTKYSGREEDYMKALVGKYGPEPAPPAPPKSAAPMPEGGIINTEQRHDRSIPEPGSPSSPVLPPSKPKVDPVQQVVTQQLASLSSTDAAALGNVANTPAFLNFIKGVTSSLGASGLALGGAALEQRAKALAEQEEEDREHIAGVQEDEFGIVQHMAQVAQSKIASSEESEALQRKSNEALQLLYFQFWCGYAKDRMKKRRNELLASLTPYQRVAFSKRSIKKFQDATSPTSPTSPRGAAHNASSPSLHLGSPQQQMRASSSSVGRSGAGLNNSLGGIITGATPRTAAATPRGASAAARRTPGTARSNTTLSTAAAPTPRQSIKTINTIAHGSRGGSSFQAHATTGTAAMSRAELARSRHSAESRVEKLSDNQVKSLHRRLEKWGLPVPGFLNNVVEARGLITPGHTPRAGDGGAAGAGMQGKARSTSRDSQQQQQNSMYMQNLERFGNFGSAAAAGASSPSADDSELDSTVQNVLRDISQQQQQQAQY